MNKLWTEEEIKVYINLNTRLGTLKAQKMYFENSLYWWPAYEVSIKGLEKTKKDIHEIEMRNN